jgi:hypothetical protein
MWLLIVGVQLTEYEDLDCAESDEKEFKAFAWLTD